MGLSNFNFHNRFVSDEHLLFGVLGEIETDTLTVSNSEIITVDFTVLKYGFL